MTRDTLKVDAMQATEKKPLAIFSALILGLAALGFFLYWVSPGWNATADWRGIVFEALLFLFIFFSNLVVLPHWKSARTLCLGLLLFLIGTFTDVHDEFFIQPRWVNMVIEDPTQAIGAGLIGLGIWYWVKERERLLEQLQKERDFEAALIPKLSHDLRAPLNNLMGMASVADEEPKSLESLAWVREYHGLVWRGAKDMNLLIENILENYRLKSGTVALKPSPVSLLPLLDEACQDFHYQARKKEITLVKDGPFEDLVLEADGVKVTRIVQNLLGNAIKFSPKGGKVILRAKPGNGEITVQVIDEGPGIPAEQVSMLTQEVPTALRNETGGENKGYGIGLKVVKEFVHLHGGRFWVEPNSPQGSQFCFTLPLRQTHGV
ncbi:MAG: HAMP domain-containing histidine kinase [Deltaproteobacteria bacterium]|nr:MAG: HAMP domain-containing histidine kinase [Deltaproteobacteria bacterium]